MSGRAGQSIIGTRVIDNRKLKNKIEVGALSLPKRFPVPLFLFLKSHSETTERTRILQSFHPGIQKCGDFSCSRECRDDKTKVDLECVISLESSNSQVWASGPHPV
jgi:hypothetical protein